MVKIPVPSCPHETNRLRPEGLHQIQGCATGLRVAMFLAGQQADSTGQHVEPLPDRPDQVISMVEDAMPIPCEKTHWCGNLRPAPSQRASCRRPLVSRSCHGHQAQESRRSQPRRTALRLPRPRRSDGRLSERSRVQPENRSFMAFVQWCGSHLPDRRYTRWRAAQRGQQPSPAAPEVDIQRAQDLPGSTG